MQTEHVGMFWVVNNVLWIKKTSLDDFRQKMKTSFNQRRVITYSDAHFRTWHNWCDEYCYDRREKHFMYHPRGRISYFPRLNKFELVIDPCLLDDNNLIDNILDECGISRENTMIVSQSDDQSLHYICHKCTPELFDNEGRCNDGKFN